MISLRRQRKIVGISVKKEAKNFGNQIKEVMRRFENEDYNKCLEMSLNLLKTEGARKNPAILAIMLKNLGAIYFKINDYESSMKYYLEALKTLEENPKIEKPRKEEIERDLGLVKILKIATEGNTEKALEECDFFMVRNPENAAAIEFKGNLSHSLGRYEDAILCYEEVISLKKEMKLESVYYKIGVCYFYLNDLETSRQYLKKALDENPRSGKIYFALGEVEFKLGLLKDAVENLEKGEKLLPKEVNCLLYLMEGYRQLVGLAKKIIPRAEKITKSDDARIFKFFIEWLKKIEEEDMKKEVLLNILPLILKRPALCEILTGSLLYGGDFLITVIKDFKKEKELNRKKNIKLIQLMDGFMKLLEKGLEEKKARIQELWLLFHPFFEKETIEESMRKNGDSAKDALEYELLEKVMKKHDLPKEWMGFAASIKETQRDLINPLKSIDYFLNTLNIISDKTTVSFCDDEKGAMRIEEGINSVKFSIFPDFPGKIGKETLGSLAGLYEKRLNLWEKLPDLIMKGKFTPPLLPTAAAWAKKTGEKLPDDSLLLNELEREGNNLKLDLLMQKTEKEYVKMIRPIIMLANNSISIPFKVRFQEREIKAKEGESEFFAFKYFSYVRKNTKVKA